MHFSINASTLFNFRPPRNQKEFNFHYNFFRHFLTPSHTTTIMYNYLCSHQLFVYLVHPILHSHPMIYYSYYVSPHNLIPLTLSSLFMKRDTEIPQMLDLSLPGYVLSCICHFFHLCFCILLLYDIFLRVMVFLFCNQRLNREASA